MALPVYRYPLDKTGENPDNQVLNEPHSLTPKSRPTDVRVAAPLYGPFFAESVHVVDRANGISLVKGSDYKVTDLLQDPTLKFGKEIGQFIVITNGAVSNEIAISYQVLGGNYQNDASAVQHVFETFLNDTRPVDWTNISGKPSTFPPTLHIHLLEDIVGWGPVIVALDRVRDAILLHNTPMFEALIDWVSTRKFKWVDLTGTPTTLGGYGITDGVNVSRKINTAASSGLKGGGDLRADRDLSLTDTGVAVGIHGTSSKVAQFTVDRHGRLTKVTEVGIKAPWADITDKPASLDEFGITDAVSNKRKINTNNGSGLQGGGDLTADRNLSLTNTGVVAGNYGAYNQIPAIAVDSHGRITRVNSIDVSVDWKLGVTGKPTTVLESGLTDAVATSRRVDTGTGLQGGGNLANNLEISLRNTGVTPTSYGSGSAIPVITVDAQGRITAARTVASSPAWGNISGRPSTIGGYGITDAVTLNTSQTVTSYKFFNSMATAWGSTAANIDNGAQSKIVTEDYLRRYVANAISNNAMSGMFARWTNLTGSRQRNVTYRNDTGYPMMVSIVPSGQGGAGTPSAVLSVNGIAVVRISGFMHSEDYASDTKTIVSIIPVNGTYILTGGSIGLTPAWCETR